MLVARTYRTTRVKEKVLLLASQTFTHTVMHPSRNCEFHTSETVIINSNSNFSENYSLRGGGNSNSNMSSNDCLSGSCVRIPRLRAVLDSVTVNFGRRPKLAVEATPSERANQVVEREQATLQILYENSDKSNWTYNKTKDFYKNVLKMDELFDPKVSRRRLAYVKGGRSITVRFHDNYVTIANNSGSYQEFKTNKKIFQNRLKILTENGEKSKCPHAFEIRQTFQAPQMGSGVPGNIENINAKIEGDHVLGSKISKAAKHSRESGQVVYKPWITHSAHGYSRKLEELNICFPGGEVRNALAVNKTSFAAGHDIDDFFEVRQRDARNALRRIPDSQFLPEAPRPEMEVAEFRALEKEHKNYKQVKIREGFTKKEMLYQLNGALCANQNSEDVIRFTKNLSRDLSICRNSNGEYTLAKKKATRFGKLMISQSIEAKIYITGIKLVNPRPDGMPNYQSHALTDACDEILLSQRTQVRAMVNELKAAGITDFDRSMEYFENFSGTKKDDWPMSARAIYNAAEGMTDERLDELGSRLQITVVELERDTGYTLSKSYTLCLDKNSEDVLPSDNLAFQPLESTELLEVPFQPEDQAFWNHDLPNDVWEGQ